MSGSDYRRNQEVYNDFWSSRLRRYWTYSNQGKLRRFRRLTQKAGLLSRPRLRVFEMGFGLGSMLFCFDASCDLAGTELSEGAVRAAEAAARKRGFEHVDFRVFQPGAPYPAEWHHHFDVVIASHVLEHIENPEPALRDLLDLLRPGGIACLIVPVNEQQGDDLNHFHLFTEASFRRLLEKVGLQIMSIHSSDRILNMVRPLIKRTQAGGSKLDRLQSIGFNLAFGFAPLWVFEFMDFKLLPKSWPFCQCFALGRMLELPKAEGTR